MRRGHLGVASVGVMLAVAAITISCSSESTPAPIRVGAIYPLSGPQGPGGVDEFRGVRLAATIVNQDGGIDGRPIRIDSVDVPGSDAAVSGVAAVADSGARIVLGSYGSTISAPAAQAAAERGMLYWETGAVGEMMGPQQGDLIFRVSPTGSVLGHSAVSFISDQLAPLLHRTPDSLRFAVANVNDVYGNAVADGAIKELEAEGLNLVGTFPYDPQHWHFSELVKRIAAAKPDVLFVSAYVDDAVALRNAMVQGHLPLLASIGTSSSYCMPAFGKRLGPNAVGLFASDKPDEATLNPNGLEPEAAQLLHRAATAYQSRYGEEMSAPALAGFSAAWALFDHVMPQANGITPSAIADAARSMDLPTGALPNGSGLSFGAPGTPDAGANLRAASVIEEWTGVDQREIVWPPRYATTQVRALPLAG
jgi:branched-chain amino acid transport system substrate-binding protein